MTIKKPKKNLHPTLVLKARIWGKLIGFLTGENYTLSYQTNPNPQPKPTRRKTREKEERERERKEEEKRKEERNFQESLTSTAALRISTPHLFQ